MVRVVLTRVTWKKEGEEKGEGKKKEGRIKIVCNEIHRAKWNRVSYAEVTIKCFIYVYDFKLLLKLCFDAGARREGVREGTLNLTHEIERSALFIIKRGRALVKFNVKPLSSS